jgi:TolB-like protein
MLVLLTISLNAQETQIRRIALLPLTSIDVDYASMQTSESILRMELGNKENINLISKNKTLSVMGEKICDDEECAQDIGGKLEASEVLICKLNRLGEKIIVQYQLINVESGKIILSERATSVSLEDLDAVMKRVAISVSRLSPFDANQEVGNIVQQESMETLRRKARYNFGVGFGYLFPTQGYDESRDRSFTINAYFDYELQDLSAGLMIGARKGFAINIYANYLFTRTDVCPYAGASLGFHWVAHEGIFYANNKDEDGVELGLKGGVRLFHTYNFQIFIQGEYIMTFNDYNDKAIIFTIGIL